MATGDRLTRSAAALGTHAMAYPGATEHFPWGERAIKIRGKVFVFLSLFEGVLHVTVKLPDSGAHALTLPFASPTGYGLGKSGWVTARFARSDAVPLDMLRAWIDESFRAVAPRKVVAALDDDGGDAAAPPARPKRKRKDASG